MEFIRNSADIIQKQIDEAKSGGTNKAKISGFYEIEKTVLQLAGEMRDVYLENIRGFDNNPNFIINDSNLDIDKILKN